MLDILIDAHIELTDTELKDEYRFDAAYDAVEKISMKLNVRDYDCMKAIEHVLENVTPDTDYDTFVGVVIEAIGIK